jgi:hypothetical protein
MPASNRQVNFGATTFVKSGGGSTTFKHVRKFSYKTGGKAIQDKGDAAFYPTHTRVIEAMPEATVQHRDAGLIKTLPEGTKGTFSTVQLDADNDTGSGAITYSFATAHIVSHDVDAEHANYGTVSLTMRGNSADGTTNPMTMTIAP